MLNVTKLALDRLSRKIAGRSLTHAGPQETSADLALRFTRRPGGWKLGPDRARPGDVTFACDGRNVLLLDEAAAQAMTNLTLDVRITAAGPRLRLRRGENTGI